MSLDEMFESEKRQEERLLANWAEYDEANEKLLSEMEKQVESKEWSELK